MYTFSKTSLKHREGVDQRLIDISDLAIRLSTVDFGIPGDGGVRTEARQNELYLSGVSKCDGVIKISNHQTGNALDVYAYVGKASWEPEHLTTVACAMLQAASMLGHKMIWGGHWTSYCDMPHFELD